MSEQDWTEWFAKSFMVFLNGDALRSRDRRGRPIHDDSFLLVFNAHVDAVSFTIPGDPWGASWMPVLDTVAAPSFLAGAPPIAGGTGVERAGLSLQVLTRGQHSP
jgi:glycogen operon protein